MGERRVAYRVLAGKPEGVLSVDGIRILKWMFREYGLD